LSIHFGLQSRAVSWGDFRMTSEFEPAGSVALCNTPAARRRMHDMSPRPRFPSDRPLADDPLTGDPLAGDPSANANEFTRDITQRL
jgi:hypothetical protein